ncbi:hypothetical protein ACI65C_004708 [Semiaphis heraclei]
MERISRPQHINKSRSKTTRLAPGGRVNDIAIARQNRTVWANRNRPSGRNKRNATPLYSIVKKSRTRSFSPPPNTCSKDLSTTVKKLKSSQSNTATLPENPKIPKKLPMATNSSSNPDANVVIENSNRSRSASVAGSEHADSNGNSSIASSSTSNPPSHSPSPETKINIPPIIINSRDWRESAKTILEVTELNTNDFTAHSVRLQMKCPTNFRKIQIRVESH